MSGRLTGITVALVGGDEREIILCQALLQEGALVRMAGFPQRPELNQVKCLPLLEAIAGAHAVVLPLSGVDATGRVKAHMDQVSPPLILDAAAFAVMAGKIVLIGSANPLVHQLADRYNVKVIETAANDEIAILNSIPTAEGAIYRAMAEMPITLHGSNSVVVGFGRCGFTLARMLQGLGAYVTVVARNPAQQARAWEMGMKAAPISSLSEVSAKADCLFNTVPYLVVTAEVVEALPTTALIIDIASAPGGTDFATARARGIKAFLDLGIPGRVAPRTAGQVLARTIPRLLAEACR